MQDADFGNVACRKVRAAAGFAAMTIAPEPGFVKPPIERSYGLIEIDLPNGCAAANRPDQRSQHPQARPTPVVELEDGSSKARRPKAEVFPAPATTPRPSPDGYAPRAAMPPPLPSGGGRLLARINGWNAPQVVEPTRSQHFRFRSTVFTKLNNDVLVFRFVLPDHNRAQPWINERTGFPSSIEPDCLSLCFVPHDSKQEIERQLSNVCLCRFEQCACTFVATAAGTALRVASRFGRLTALSGRRPMSRVPSAGPVAPTCK